MHINRIISQRRWWLGIGLIVLLGGGLRFTGYLFGLPYFEDMDEPWFFYEAAFQRGLITSWLHPNPSVPLISIYQLAQVISEALTQQSALAHVPQIFAVMRFVSVILSLLTLVLVGLTARELMDEKAGWLAAATWAWMPVVIYHSFIAIAEPWMMLLESLALYAAVRTLRRDSLRWPLISVWAGLLGFAFKYSMFPFAGIGLAVVLWRIVADPIHRRRWLGVVALQIVSIIAFLLAMLVFGGLVRDVSSPAREVAIFLNNPLDRLSNLNRVAGIVGGAFWQFGFAPAAFIGIYAASLILLGRRPNRLANPQLAGWILLGALGAFSAFLVPLYLAIPQTLNRYLFAASLIFIILAACSLSLLVNVISGYLKTARLRMAFSVLAIAVLVMWWSPLLGESLRQAVERTRPYTLTDMMLWASSTLDEGGILAEGAGHRAFNHEWGGYTGDARVLTFDRDVLSQSPQAWMRDGYRYVEFAQQYVDELNQTPEGRAYLSQMQELRRFPPVGTTEGWTGIQFVVFQLGRPQVETDYVFGDTLRLIGYDQPVPALVEPGTTLNFRFFWQPLSPPPDNYSVFIHLMPEGEETLLAQVDGAPGPRNRPTLSWNVGGETLVSQLLPLTIPADLPTGAYRLMLGVYQPYTGQRLATAQGMSIRLATFEVTGT